MALFLKYTESDHQLYQQVFQRVHSKIQCIIALIVAFLTFNVDPLISCLMKNPEIEYQTLKYIELLLDRSPKLFEDDFKFFYATHRDPDYLKILKLDILTRVAVDWSAPFIVDEISYAVLEYTPEVGSAALQTLSKIAINFPSVAEQAFARLLDLFSLDYPWLTSSCLCVIADLLRKYPMEGIDVVTACKRTLEDVNKLEDTNSLNAAIWMLGEFGEQIATAPYVLELLVDKFDELESSTRNLLLTSTIKLFGKRPPECQPILGDLIAICAEQTSDPLLMYKAMFYYRLLKYDLPKCFEVVNSLKDPIDKFIDSERNILLSDQLFDEFDTLAVVYGKPCSFYPSLLVKDISEEEEEEEEEEDEIVQHTQQIIIVDHLADKTQFTMDPSTFEQHWQQWNTK